MHSYTTLAVLALAVSTASPAFSAPVLESKHLARAEIDERASILPSGLGSDIGSLVKSIGTNAAFGAVPVAIEHFLGGNSTRRALSDDEKRGLGTILKTLGAKIAKAGLNVASKVGRSEVQSREPEPFSLGGLGSFLASLGEAAVLRRDDVSRDLIDSLRLLNRQLDELD